MPQTQRNLKYMVLNEISYSEKVTYCIITTILHFAKSKIIRFLGGSEGEESACSVEDTGLTLGMERSPGEGNGCPLQYSCLENSRDRGTWWATVHGVAKSLT